MQAGEFAFAGGVRFEAEIRRATGHFGNDQSGAGTFIGDDVGRPEFSSSDVANKTCSAKARSSIAEIEP
jgi:hypothetical protein